MDSHIIRERPSADSHIINYMEAEWNVLGCHVCTTWFYTMIGLFECCVKLPLLYMQKKHLSSTMVCVWQVRMTKCTTLVRGLLLNVNLNKTNLRRLQKLQNRGGHIILKAESRTYINDMRSDIKWLTIEQRHRLYTSVMVYTVMNSLAPNYLCKYFTDLSDRNITCCHTRGLLEILKKQLGCGQRTFQYSWTKLWNDIPQHVCEASSLDTFRRLYSATAVKCLMVNLSQTFGHLYSN